MLFGSLQRITAEQLGLSPILMAAANSSGGVMGKMVDAQSIVVASTGHALVRARGRHPALRLLPQPGAAPAWSASSCLLQAYVYPFTALVVSLGGSQR